MVVKWIPDEEALGLLNRSDEPFMAPAYRRAWTESEDGWRDVSFGARAGAETRAAIALLRRGHTAHSLPLGYGGVVASRSLSAGEVDSFLRAARREAGAYDLSARSVPILPSLAGLHEGGRVVAWTSVLYLDRDAPATARLTKKGSDALARAQRAGGVSRGPTSDPDQFLQLYERASRTWSTHYPPRLLKRLAEAGSLTTFDVELGGSVEASAVALRGQDHWMYWLAAQSDVGRSAELGYCALAALISDAHAAGARAVNLGASAGLSGVAMFKRRFGSVDVPVFEHRSRHLVSHVAEFGLRRLPRRGH